MDCSSRCGADETAHGCPWSLQRTSLPSFTKYHRTLKTKIRSTSCLQKQGRNYTRSKALICHHIRLKLARLDSLSWTTVQWVSLLWMCARTQTRKHARWLKPALTYISGWWQAAAGKWVCGAQTEKTHCSQTRAAGLRWASRNTLSKTERSIMVAEYVVSNRESCALVTKIECAFAAAMWLNVKKM